MTFGLTLLSPGAVTAKLTAKLRRRPCDLDRIADTTVPTAAELAQAPLLVDWRLVPAMGGLALTGFAAGHLRLGATRIITSPLWALDPQLRWARSLSRFVRLGLPEGVVIPAEDASGEQQSLKRRVQSPALPERQYVASTTAAARSASWSWSWS
jgi:hypothetical protein